MSYDPVIQWTCSCYQVFFYHLLIQIAIDDISQSDVPGTIFIVGSEWHPPPTAVHSYHTNAP
jgi:hypothetical protein